MTTKMKNSGNTYKNRHVVKEKKENNHGLKYPDKAAKKEGWVSVEEVLNDFRPIDDGVK
jgi:hypothetical protein